MYSHIHLCSWINSGIIIISRSVRITHAGSLGVGLGLGGLGAVVGGRGVKGWVSHDILYLLIICQMSKCQTPWLWRRFEKKRTWHNEAQTLWGQIWPHMWTSPKHLENIFYEHLGCFDDHQIWPQNWPHHIWASLCQVFFFINLLHRPGVWHFDIWQIISLMSDLMSDHVSDLVSEQIFIFFKIFKIFKILLFHIF